MKTPRLAIIGSGELAYHIAHYAKEDKQFEVTGFYDDFTLPGTMVNGYPILGTLNDIEHQFNSGKFDNLLVAVGYSRMIYRKEVFERFEKTIPMAKLIHSSCYIDPDARIGPGCVIFPKCTIFKDVIIEKNVFIQIGLTMADSLIGKHTMLSPSVSIAGHCKIGECCNIGISTTIINDIQICDFVRTGGGTVITRNINESGLYVGMPARRIGDFK